MRTVTDCTAMSGPAGSSSSASPSGNTEVDYPPSKLRPSTDDTANSSAKSCHAPDHCGRAVEVFRVLGDARIPHAIATASYRPIIDASVQAVGVGPEAIVVEGKGEFQGKPEPDLFLASRDRLGVESGDCNRRRRRRLGHVAALRAGMLRRRRLTGGTAKRNSITPAHSRVPQHRRLLLKTWMSLGSYSDPPWREPATSLDRHCRIRSEGA